MTNTFPLSATTLFGLEEILAEELRSLGAKNIRAQRRFVEFSGDQYIMYKANLWCRTAIRILKPIASFAIHKEKDLYNEIKKIRWDQYITTKSTIAIDSFVRNSIFTHSLYVSQLTKDAIIDQMRDKSGTRPGVDLKDPDLRLNLHIQHNNVVLSLDSSGDSLHKRGYRIQTNTVPLNEVLAAGILYLTGWDRNSSFIDPMCGSGTFLIEAAMMALGRIPGYYRSKFGFMRWLDFDAGLYHNIQDEAVKAEKDALAFPIEGSDVNKKTFQIACRNVQNAAMEDFIQIHHKAFEEQTPPPAPGVMVMNPPYGERQEVNQLQEKYKMIGDVLKSMYEGYTAYILTGNLQEAKHIGLRTSFRKELFNGPIDCRLLKFELYSGSRR
jgi:putative N6-adenine-specific DNA methylase